MRRRSGGGDGSTASRSTGDANRATVADRSTSLTSRTDGSPSSEVLRDHRVEPEDRGIHRDGVHRLEMRHQCRDRTAHRHTGYRDRGGLRLQPAHDRSDLRHRPHHPRDVGQRIHVRIGRPCFATDAVARLHRQRDVETELALDAPGPREQEIQRLPLPCAVHPYQPRSPVITLPAQVYRCGRRAARSPRPPTTAAAAGRARTSAAHRPNVRTDCRRIALTMQGFRVERERRHRALTTRRPRPRTLPRERSSVGGGAVSVIPVSAASSISHLTEKPNTAWRQRIPPFSSAAQRAPAAARPRHPGRSATLVPTSSSASRA